MPINKVFNSIDEALFDVFDGATIMFAGFGVAGTPSNLIAGLIRRGTKNVTAIIQGGIGAPFPDGTVSTADLAEHKLVKKVYASFIGFPSQLATSAFGIQMRAGEVELEVVPQGTLVERIRAGGAGLGGFYTPTGVGTIVAEGKEHRVINGKEHILELPLTADFAFIRGKTADKMGNLTYNYCARNFNPAMATAAKVTVAEVEEIVEPGELDPEAIVTPGIFVHRIVLAKKEAKRETALG